jgi:hypothetical protein
MDHRQLARALAVGRIVVGGAMVALPGVTASRWIGDAGSRAEVKVVTRAFGVRDLALGVGTLQALTEGQPVRPWVLLGALSDAVDGAATVLAARRIGLRRAAPVVALSLAAAAIGLAGADQVD